ncbi:MAG: polyprenol monophosphomannose synthase [Acidimicrobiales bacterium]|nr:polyprenol monophosphomannose synthase [Acidimicrobiales bacterium]
MPDVRRPLVVIPTYQEADNVDVVLRKVRSAAPDAHVLVVDDNSPDGTADLAEALGAEVGGVTVLRRPAKEGLGSAYRAGFDWGLREGYTTLVEMDADLSHDPADLPRLLAAVDDGAALAIGSRYVPGGGIPHWPMHRRLLSRWGNRYVETVLGLGIRDATAGFRAYRAEILGAIDYETTGADGYAFQVEMAYRARRAGGSIVELPIVFADRERGTSKMSGRIVAEAMLLVTWWALRDRVLRRRR